MRLGDALEILAAAVFVVAAGLATGLIWPAFVVAGVALAYEAQCVPERTLPRLRLPHRHQGDDAQ